MRLRTFHGGVHPPTHKEATAGEPIRDCPLPPELVVPLLQHIGAPAEALVKPGDRVGKGQMLGRARGFISAPVHAPTSGEVIAVESRPHSCGRNLPAVVIRPDGQDAWAPGIAAGDPDRLAPDELRQRLREAGVVGMGGAGFPTHVKMSPPDGRRIHTLIINGAECEPYLTADHRLMLEEPERILQGIAVMRRILGAQRVLLGIEANKPDAVAVLREKSRGEVEVTALPVMYPQGAERQLIYSLLRREVPSGGLPMDIGVVVQNVATAAAAGDAVLGIPCIERVVTVAGSAVKRPANLRVRIGTPLSWLVEQCGGWASEPAKVVVGGPMMGTAQISLQVPVIRGTSGVIAFTAAEVPLRPEGPCIRCGRCVAACPARILPTTVAAYARLNRMQEAAAADAMDCIECGSCSYTCPAAIPLIQSIRLAKGAILEARRKI